MRQLSFLILMCVINLGFSQVRTELGVNLTPLLLNSLDLQAEWQLAPTFSLVANTGIRHQTLGDDQEAPIRVLENYVHPRNTGAYLSVGGRFFNKEVNEYQFPFVQFGLVGSYSYETILKMNDADVWEKVPSSRFQFGITTTIGVTLRMSERAHVDLALQMGYTKPREDISLYYTPGMGYTTYGIDAISIRGAHLQPMLVFKYNILQDKRQRIRSME